MIVQLSSGQGPSECELAVLKLYEALKKEYPDIEFLSAHEAREKRCYTSIIFTTERDLSDLEGSIQWICRSPFRPNHKRKNWFVDVSIIPEMENICKDQDIRFERFHSGGKGGQNVNKVESGVRLRYVWQNPNTGVAEEILIECTETRDQPKNKERALSRLRTFIYDKEHQKYIDDISAKRKTMVSTGDRSAKIRTYNYPQGRITDHRINYTIYNLTAFMDGDIQDCIDHLIVAENAERLKESEL